MKKIPIGYFSLNILKEPAEGTKGALILSQIDAVVSKCPFIKDKFYLIERRGWRGINDAEYADIKLVEDLSFWEETLKRFPQSICLDIGPADFVDTDSFRPIGIKKEYDGIHISHWTAFKRPELFVRAAGLIPERKFVKLGHFMKGGSREERKLRNSIVSLAEELGANMEFPYRHAKNNKDFPKTKEFVSSYINKSKIGILTTTVEGINRFKMECLASGIPVLVPEDVSYPTKKHINEETGEFFEPTPAGLANKIEYVLSTLNKYNSRSYIERTTGKPKSIAKLKNALKMLCERDGTRYIFDGIDWDGRNSSLIWGNKVFECLSKYGNY